jgi:threonine dehydrogenase-like Zn-dependent dehydrogenase
MSTADTLIRSGRAARLTGRAAIVAAPRRISLTTRQPPEPAAGDVRIRLEGSGVCGSNLPLWMGRDWFEYPQAPGAPGHEGWGVVDAVGDGVTTVAVGDRVAALSNHAFAEYDVARAAHVVALPASLGDMPVPGEALGCAVNVFRRSGITAGQHVAIVGIGFLGALLTQLASRAGAHVTAISRREFALEVGRACGAAATVELGEHHHVIDRVREATDGGLCDCVIEATGMQRPLDLAAALTRERGRLVIAGFHQDGPRQVDMFLWNWRGLDVINAHERDPAVYVEGMRAAIDAIAAGGLDPAALYTHELPLDRLDTALDLAVNRPDGFLKALVRT